MAKRATVRRVENPDAAGIESRAVAACIHHMALELSRLASRSGLCDLACFLEMAAIEAPDRSESGLGPHLRGPREGASAGTQTQAA